MGYNIPHVCEVMVCDSFCIPRFPLIVDKFTFSSSHQNNKRVYTLPESIIAS